jgi:hypothetical protein
MKNGTWLSCRNKVPARSIIPICSLNLPQNWILKLKNRAPGFMTWALKDVAAEISLIAASYGTVGLQLKDKVVPAGRVWEYFVKNNQTIDLYDTDKKHPSLAGTYLVTCVFYYSVFNKNPVENSYFPVGLSAENAITIRRIVHDYFNTNQ